MNDLIANLSVDIPLLSEIKDLKEMKYQDDVPHPNYRIIKTLLDSSPFATVFEAIWTGSPIFGYVQTNQKVIVKRCNSLLGAYNEIQILENLMHKTNIYTDFFMKLIFTYDVKPNQEIDLVIQYGGIDAFEFFVPVNSCLSQCSLTERICYVSEIVSKLLVCVIKLHSLRLVHNDIKPENIVIQRTRQNILNVNLIDFAIASNAITINDCTNMTVSSSSKAVKVGSEFYIHPHILWNRPLSLYKNDLWAIGQTCFRLYTQSCIYDFELCSDETRFQVLDLFLSNPNWNNEMQCSPELTNHNSFPLFTRFVSRMCCLAKSPEKADMLLLQDPFLCLWNNL